MAENIYGIKQWLWDFALETISKHNMDDSHGIRHFTNTYLYVQFILAEFHNQTLIEGIDNDTSRDIICDAAFAHDLIDGKYMDENSAVNSLRYVFLQNGYDPEHLEIIIYIITNMSFSKRQKRLRNGQPMIEPNKYARAVGIVVDADQLDAYDVHRCRIYQEIKYSDVAYPNLSNDERSELIRGWQNTILRKRVLMYKNTYMNTEMGKKLAEPLHEKVLRHVEKEFADAKLFDY